MDIFHISHSAFLKAILTFFSGFGLGTILTPVFMVFFPVDLAIAVTGVVHFFNPIFKLFLVSKNADRGVLIRLGIAVVIAAILGSWLLLNITDSAIGAILTGLIADSYGIDMSILAIGGLTVLSAVLIAVRME